MGCLQDFIGKLVFQENHVDTTSKDVVDNMEKGFSLFFLKYTRLGFRFFRVFRCFRNSIIFGKKSPFKGFFYKKAPFIHFFVVSLYPNARDDVVHRGVAQLVAHLVWDQVVARSSRVTPTPISRASVPDAMLDVSGTGFGERLSPLVYTKRGCLWQHCLMHWQPR